MKPLLYEFCWLAPLRTGCIIIGCFKIVTATMYLIGYFSHSGTNDPDANEKCDEYFYHEGITISLLGCAFNYVVSVVLFIGIFMNATVMILVSAILLLLYSVFDVLAAAYAGYADHFAPCIALTIYAVLDFYFTVVTYSHYNEIKEEEIFLAIMDGTLRQQLEQERSRAKEQGLPDPLKAALRKYRAPVEEDRERKNRSPVKPTEEATGSQQPTPSGN